MSKNFKKVKPSTITDLSFVVNIIVVAISIFQRYFPSAMKGKNLENGKSEPKAKNLYPSFVRNLKEYLFEYSANSSLHCVRYLGEKKRSYVERFTWFTIISISLSLCIFLIAKTYVKWVNSPVIVSFATSSTPVWEIPFPAITVCPETKSKQRDYNYTEAYHKFHETPENMTEDELTMFEQASLICNNLNQDGNKTVDSNCIEFLAEIAPKFGDVLWQCKWTNLNQTCDTLLTTVLTEEGVCFTFNILDRDDIFTKEVSPNGMFNRVEFGTSPSWTLEKGYDNNVDTQAYPLRSFSAGHRASFSLLMTLYQQDFDYICKGALQGYKILLHNPTEMPQVSQQYFRASINQETTVIIKPEMMTTAATLKKYRPESRYCFFPTERHLKYFKTYTQRNCEMECLTNCTLVKCGCVAYHMPRNISTKICGSGSTTCMKNANAEMVAREVDFSIESLENDNENKQDTKEYQSMCNCLPSCTSLSYNAESLQADFNWPKVFQAYDSSLDEFPGIVMTRVTFFFKEQQFQTYERNELYGAIDFFANCGGLLGLFIGFSLLSVIEILYFLTLRIWCNIKKYGCKFWSGSPKLIEDYQKNK